MMFTYELLNQDQKECYESMLRDLRCGHCRITLKKPLHGPDDIVSLVRAVQADHPEFYYLGRYKIWHTMMGMGTEVEFEDVEMNEEECQETVRKVEQWADDVLSYLKIRPGQDSTYEICKKVHNFLIRYASYDKEALESEKRCAHAFSVEGIVRYRKAVCEGIAKTFLLLCRRARAEVFLIEGNCTDIESYDKTDHMWNLVKIGEDYVHVDVTWDMEPSQKCGSIRYDYFMIPDRWICMDHGIAKPWPACKTEKYSNFVRQGRVFSDAAQMCRYIRKEIKNNHSDIYFKLDLDDPASEMRKDMLMKTFSQILHRCKRRSGYKVWMNAKQNVFLFQLND